MLAEAVAVHNAFVEAEVVVEVGAAVVAEVGAGNELDLVVDNKINKETMDLTLRCRRTSVSRLFDIGYSEIRRGWSLSFW